jgi:tRNA (cytidine/uridine-2'-O-)-methyltransferase
MFEIVLFEPEIPPNTGNIMRLCANVPARLHLIEPLGFALDDRRLRRAGLDYRDRADVRRHPSFEACREALADRRWLAFTTRGSRCYTDWSWRPGDVLLFGPETRGLPANILEAIGGPHCLRLPQQPEARSLNLSNAVAVAAYEVWRQFEFKGSAG